MESGISWGKLVSKTGGVGHHVACCLQVRDYRNYCCPTGEGNYGVVYTGKSRRTGHIRAVKIMDAVFDKEDDIKAELLVFEKYASHPNMVDFYGSYLKKQDSAEDQLWIVMEVRRSSSLRLLAGHSAGTIDSFLRCRQLQTSERLSASR